jgi:hypothetical protein
VSYHEIIERKFAGDKLAVRFLRDGGANEVQIELKPLQWGRMYAIDYESKPRYIVFAGLVFQPLDTNVFASMKFDDINVRRLYSDYVSKGVFQKRQDIVVLTRVESDPVTSQLDGFAGFAVDKINGVEVRDFKHAYELLHPKDAPEFHVIELFGANRPVVIPGALVEAANRRVQASCGISKLRNLDP